MVGRDGNGFLGHSPACSGTLAAEHTIYPISVNARGAAVELLQRAANSCRFTEQAVGFRKLST